MRKKLILILAMLTMSVSIFACGAQETATQENPTARTEEVAQVSEVETTDVTSSDTDLHQEVATEAEKTEAEASVAESTAEPTPEPTPEPNPYEGIDMESTLPGVEWMDTFEGIIDEPKIVVFNDETNKKIIVGDGETAELTQEDMLSIYTPNNLSVVLMEGENIDGTMYYSPVCTHVMIRKVEGENLIGVTFLDTNNEMMSIACTIVVR